MEKLTKEHELNPLCPVCAEELIECKVFETGQPTFVSAEPKQWRCESCKKPVEDEDLEKTTYILFERDANGLPTHKAERVTVYQSRQEEYFEGLADEYSNSPESYPTIVDEAHIPPKPEEGYHIKVTYSEIREIGEVTYPEMTDDDWDDFQENFMTDYNRCRTIEDIISHLDLYMERQKDEIATHRQCIHFVPTELVNTFSDRERKQLLRTGVKGVCFEGGFTEIGDPDDPVSAHEDGCNAFKKSEPFATNDMVMPRSNEVIKSTDYVKLATEMIETYDPSDYQVRTSIWEQKPAYCELHRVLHVYSKETGKKVEVIRWAFIKSHMTGEIKSV